jgi:sigma-B regulation protein RsbU (phosphoserine phosphatase)
MSMFYLTIDKGEKCLRWVRAGHDPAVIYDPKLDTLSELKGAGIALGVDEQFQFEENSRTDLREGQIILLGTDGIWEARNPEGEMFGKESMYALLRQNKDRDAAEILTGITEALDDFQRGATIEDDVTLIVIKLTHGF